MQCLKHQPLSRGVFVSWCYGGHGGGETPGPIPNPEVKPSSADGTARVTEWESRSLPEHRAGEPPSGGSPRFRGRFIARPAFDSEGSRVGWLDGEGAHPSTRR